MPDATPTSPAISVQFGEPEHGWLPVRLQAGTFQLALDASDIPVNPLELLCEALTVVPAGGSAEVLWHLEPAMCWFTFESQAGNILFTIIESLFRSQPKTCTLQLTGSVEAILLPFYQALKKFTAHKFSHSQWPALDQHRLERLDQLFQK